MSADETHKLAAVFENLGAAEGQARTMAGQLLKRAEQMAEERGIPRVDALNYLVQVAIAGHQGHVFEGDPPENRAAKPDGRDIS